MRTGGRTTAIGSMGFNRAPVVLLAYTSPDVYVSRYAEPDKVGAGLGEGPDRWPVPYWYGDAAFALMAVLLGAVDAGLLVCILGTFRGAEGARHPIGRRHRVSSFLALSLIGHPDGPRTSVGVTRPPALRGLTGCTVVAGRPSPQRRQTSSDQYPVAMAVQPLDVARPFELTILMPCLNEAETCDLHSQGDGLS